MSTNIRMENYKIVGQIKDLSDARVAVETLDRGLWGTEHGVLRDDVASLRHDLAGAENLNKDLSQRVEGVISRFTELEANTLNKDLLDNSSLPKGALAPKDSSTKTNGKATNDGPEPLQVDDKDKDDTPSPKKSATSDEPTPAWAKELRKDFLKFSATDDKGNPTKAAADADLKTLESRVYDLEEGTGYQVDDKGEVSFTKLTNLSTQSFNWKTAGITALLVFLIMFVLSLTAFGMVASFSLLFSAVIGVIAGAIAGAISAHKS